MQYRHLIQIWSEEDPPTLRIDANLFLSSVKAEELGPRPSLIYVAGRHAVQEDNRIEEFEEVFARWLLQLLCVETPTMQLA